MKGTVRPAQALLSFATIGKWKTEISLPSMIDWKLG
jgi:hypothetical protein